jgi:hypothetical protein
MWPPSAAQILEAHKAQPQIIFEAQLRTDPPSDLELDFDLEGGKYEKVVSGQRK